MSEIEKRAVVSVYDKTDMECLIHELAVRRWQIYGSQGTADVCNTETQKPVTLTSELVGMAAANDSEAREKVARKVSRLMVARKSIQLACLNLRPARLDTASGASAIDFDEGGFFMIASAIKSGALVVTNPRRYDDLLEQLDRPNGVQPVFRQQLQRDTSDHLTNYFINASGLID